MLLEHCVKPGTAGHPDSCTRRVNSRHACEWNWKPHTSRFDAPCKEHGKEKNDLLLTHASEKQITVPCIGSRMEGGRVVADSGRICHPYLSLVAICCNPSQMASWMDWHWTVQLPNDRMQAAHVGSCNPCHLQLIGRTILCLTPWIAASPPE